MSDNTPTDKQHEELKDISNQADACKNEGDTIETSDNKIIEKDETVETIEENTSDTSPDKDEKMKATTDSAKVEAPSENQINQDDPTFGEEEEEETIHSSDDLEEEDEDETDQAEKEFDYSNLSEKQLLTKFRELVKIQNIPSISDAVHALRVEFNKRFEEDLEDQKQTFLAEGGNIIDFHYTTQAKKEFNSILFDYREKRNNYYKNLKRDLQANLKKRESIIEELKGLLNVEENINTTYQHFKKLQEQWHTAGPIPRDAYNLTWNTYRHHVENFYDFMHLNREFRDLDFKHNLEQKLKIITRAEELAQQSYAHKVFRELQMLHKMWKEDVGPVAKEYREDIWERFSEATKKIHQNRQDYLQDEEKILEANYEQKLVIIEAIRKLAENTKPNHNAWQQAIKTVQKQRDTFFGIGRVPRTKNRETWDAFKDVTRAFNRTKNSFYRDQKKEQIQNLEKKQELIRIAEEHKNSEDFDTVTPLMKRIQSDWKKIGHVPHKQSDKVWKQFKNACNHYFNRLFADRDKQNEGEFDNFKKKEALLTKVKNFTPTDNKENDMETLTSYMDAWHEIGRVPRNKMRIDSKFNKALDSLFKNLNISKTQAELLKYNNKLHALASQNNKEKLKNEHFFISKKIDEAKDMIRQLENNLGFFQNTDEDNPLYRKVVDNITEQKEKLKVWKGKLTQIKDIRDY